MAIRPDMQHVSKMYFHRDPTSESQSNGPCRKTARAGFGCTGHGGCAVDVGRCTGAAAERAFGGRDGADGRLVLDLLVARQLALRSGYRLLRRLCLRLFPQQLLLVKFLKHLSCTAQSLQDLACLSK